MSNLAWPADQEAEAAVLLEALGVKEVEIAPTKVFAAPERAPVETVRAYAEFWRSHGISVVALQSLLFGRPDLTVFGGAVARRALQRHLVGLFGLAQLLGAQVLVFGSPGQRRVPEGMSTAEADKQAATMFTTLARFAEADGVVLAIEPNPVAYGANFVTDARSGAALVARVGHPAFRLHLDAAAMTLADDDVGAAVMEGDPVHVHASAPGLGALDNRAVDHGALARALARRGYQGAVSIEMVAQDPARALDQVRDAVALVRAHYEPELRTVPATRLGANVDEDRQRTGWPASPR